jgi:hypothetical protein
VISFLLQAEKVENRNAKQKIFKRKPKIMNCFLGHHVRICEIHKCKNKTLLRHTLTRPGANTSNETKAKSQINC